MHRKKVLFQYEMRSMLVFFCIGLAVALLAVTNMAMTLSSLLEPVMSRVYTYSYQEAMYFPTGCILGDQLTTMLTVLIKLCNFGFLIMAMVQFSDLHGRGKREYLNSLPFSQGEKFGMKLFVSYGMITVCCAILSVGVLLLRLRYYPQILKNNALLPNFHQMLKADTLWHTLRSLTLFWLTMLAIYSVYMLMAYIIHNSILSSIAGFAILYYPVVLVSGFQSICDMGSDSVFARRILGTVESGYDSIYLFSQSLTRYARLFFGDTFGYRRAMVAQSEMDLFGNSTYEPKHSGWIDFGHQPTMTISYGKMWVSFLLVIAVLTLCTWIAWHISQKQDLARIHTRISSGIGQNIINLIVSTSLGTIITRQIAYAISENPSQYPSLKFFIGIWLLGSASVFLISHFTKIWKRI